MKKVLIWIGLAVATYLYLYWVTGNWILAVGIMIMLGLHEGGHLLVAKWCGLKTGGFYFLPGLGAAAITNEDSPKRRHDFWIYYGGPAVGAILVFMLAGVFSLFGADWSAYYQQSVLQVFAVWIFINLFNLLPIFPLDGGGLLWAIMKSFWKGYSPWGARVACAAGILFLAYCGLWLWVVLLIYFGHRYINTRHVLDMTQPKEPMRLYECVLCSLAFVILVLSFLGATYILAIQVGL